jgi:hypothetical protein
MPGKRGAAWPLRGGLQNPIPPGRVAIVGHTPLALHVRFIASLDLLHGEAIRTLPHGVASYRRRRVGLFRQLVDQVEAPLDAPQPGVEDVEPPLQSDPVLVQAGDVAPCCCGLAFEAARTRWNTGRE